MSGTTVTVGDLHRYVVAHSSPLDRVAADLSDETRRLAGRDAWMQVPPVEAALLTFLTRLVQARRAVEVGTFTGYSALAIARGLADGGRLLCCDVSEVWTEVARRYWDRAAVSDRIELRLGPALDTLRSLPGEPHLDLAFIDADKTSYLAYWEELVPRMRPGGLVVADNVLRAGWVLKAGTGNPSTDAIRQFNERVGSDDRVDVVMLPVADGITLARKRR
jgi:caffeoyl-CoA O-methyltransferase